MADYPITAVTRRKVYSGSAGVGPYAFTFPILVQTDIVVYKNSTLLTLTTDYTVTINGTNGTGSITLVSAASASDTITIIGARAIQRTTDFVTAGDLAASSLNEQLDANIIMTQQLAEENKRTLKAPPYDPEATSDGGTLDMTMPVKANRVGRVLAFNETTGNPEPGPSISSVGTVAAATAAIDTVATNIASVNTVAGNTSNINTVAGISGNVNAVAGNISDINTVANDLNEPVSEIETVAGAITNVNAVGNNITNVNTVAGISADVTSVAGNSSNINTVAGSITNVNTAATNIASINTNATNIASINTNAANITAIQNASANATAAAASASAAAASYDQFDDRYLGAKSSDPSLDNDGNALITGAIYWNTVNNTWRVWNGTGWDNGVTNVSGFMPLSGGTFTGGVTFSAPPTISVNSSSAALRITQTGAGNALVVEDSANPDATPFVIDADGRAISGGTTSIPVGSGTASRLQFQMTTGLAFSATQYEAGAGGATIVLAKSRNASIGGNTIVQANDTIGTIRFVGDDGVNLTSSFAATIVAAVDGTPGANDMPGRLVFSTTADGASTPTERMRINSSGNVGINQTSPGSALDVKGTIRLSGATSGYVGLAPAAAAGSTTYTLPSADGTTGQVLSTNGSGTLSWATPSGGTTIPAGTVMLFAQTAAPTGFTKLTTHDNKALRVVSGTASSGGSVAFTTAFASQAVNGTVGSTTLTTAQLPSHKHTLGGRLNNAGDSNFDGSVSFAAWTSTQAEQFMSSSAPNVTRDGMVGNTGSGSSHNHSFSGTAINLAVQYVDVILATKD